MIIRLHEMSYIEITDCSVSYIVVLVRMDFLQKRALDSPYNSIRSMGLVVLYLDFNDVHLH